MPIKAFDFAKVRYNRPNNNPRKKELDKFVGIDSEAYTDGTPFMFPTSEGYWIRPEDWPHVLNRREFRRCNVFTFNLRYDSGAFLHHLPRSILKVLRFLGRVEHDGFIYKYIPHKHLSITSKETGAKFWDIQPFYNSSLNAAAKKYLNEEKHELETKKFTRTYVKANFRKIVDYGLRDADLTKRLGVLLVEDLRRFGLSVSSLYSPASIAQDYFRSETGVVDVYSPWRNSPMALKLATEAYAGGKFEVTARGSFDGYQYDIKSAYPYEIAELVDLKNANYKRSTTPPPSAQYGFARCTIGMPTALPHSIPMERDGVRYFPAGRLDATITLQELEDLSEQGVPVKVHDGYWITPTTKRKPYAKAVAKLYNMKESLKQSDPRMSKTAKIILNGWYGKMVQVIEQIEAKDKRKIEKALRAGSEYDGEVETYYKAGAAWNPIYAATITANVRLRMARAQRLLGRSCLGVHTDSILSTDALSPSELGEGLGDWGLERTGAGTIIGCGVYQLGSKSAYRGYDAPNKIPWRKRLARSGDAEHLRMKVLQVPSWIGAVARRKFTRANVFTRVTKRVDLNADSKRVWLGRTNARKLLDGLEYSATAFHSS